MPGYRWLWASPPQTFRRPLTVAWGSWQLSRVTPVDSR